MGKEWPTTTQTRVLPPTKALVKPSKHNLFDSNRFLLLTLLSHQAASTTLCLSSLAQTSPSSSKNTTKRNNRSALNGVDWGHLVNSCSIPSCPLILQTQNHFEQDSGGRLKIKTPRLSTCPWHQRWLDMSSAEDPGKVLDTVRLRSQELSCASGDDNHNSIAMGRGWPASQITQAWFLSQTRFLKSKFLQIHPLEHHPELRRASALWQLPLPLVYSVLPLTQDKGLCFHTKAPARAHNSSHTLQLFVMDFNTELQTWSAHTVKTWADWVVLGGR